jgi:hypothetical protein
VPSEELAYQLSTVWQQLSDSAGCRATCTIRRTAATAAAATLEEHCSQCLSQLCDTPNHHDDAYGRQALSRAVPDCMTGCVFGCQGHAQPC